MNIDNNYIADVDEILEKYSDMVYKLALAKTGSNFDADDVFQEVFVKFMKHSHKISSEEYAKRWLIRVTITTSLDQIRIWNPPTIDISKLDLAVPLTTEEIDLINALQRLKHEERTAIHLDYYEGYSVKEISERLEIKENTIKSHLRRGREKLKEILGEEYGDELK